jgi:ligand-binding SRPBCC domain-containing protein
MPGFRSTWLTEITQVEEYLFFIDEQRIGPYRYWSHEHRFQSKGEKTEMTDIVTYQLPYGLLGSFVNKIWVRDRLKKIFEFRQRKVESIFFPIE